LERNDNASVSNKHLGENESRKPVEGFSEYGESVIEKQFKNL
jgi:hypothetical protein